MNSLVEDFFKNLPLKQRKIAFSARNVLLSLNDKMQEAFKYKTPFYCYRGKNLFYLTFPDKKQLVLGILYANELKDESGLLKGNQKIVRHIYLEQIDIQSNDFIT